MKTRIEVAVFEKLRAELEEKAMKDGLDHPEVLELSQKLDTVHNQLLKK
ncbi:Spo0E family sporulation regulatory protein-aspartic acid phosphatase [Paenibacillus taichungensis]